MKLRHLPAFLLGSREAIIAFAETRWTLAVGALLVLSGTLARCYDGAYLPREWPALLHGYPISLANSLIIYSIVHAVAASNKQIRPRFWTGYLSFLGLFWMTAPMAWLYAIPYERFMMPQDAIAFNQFTLLVVSVWRVALMTRALSVIFDAPAWRMFFLVMVFSDFAMLLAAVLMQKPVLDVMGGLQQTEIERAIVDTSISTMFFTAMSFPIWVIGSLFAMYHFFSGWRVPDGSDSDEPPPRAPRAALAFGVIAVLAWIPALLRTQPEQRLRWRTETQFRGGQVAETLTEMSEHQRSDYPPIWDPPPRPGYGDLDPPIAAVRGALADRRYAPWVEAMFYDKSWRTTVQFRHGPFTLADLESTNPLAGTLDPDGLRFHADFDPRLTEAQRTKARELADLIRSKP